jgi:hypothetical protein
MSNARTGRGVATAAAAAGAIVLGVVVVRAKGRNLGATAEELATALPGDVLVPDAEIVCDRARTISAPVEAVWPWIAQMGQDKGGFYTFRVLENLVGLKMPEVDRIVPEWQDVQPGDFLYLGEGVGMRITQVDPGRLIATVMEGEPWTWLGLRGSWDFTIRPVGDSATRFHTRERYSGRGIMRRIVCELVAPISALMTWGMMRGIGRRAPSLGPPDTDTTPTVH